MRRHSYSLIAVMALGVVAPRVAQSQTRLSLGAGGGMAGSTESSLSDGRGAPVLMAQATHSVAPFFGIGLEANYWRRTTLNATFVTAHVQLHVPVTPFYFKLGGGVGTGDPDGRGSITGVAGQIGAAYDITLPLAPVAATVFANALLGHAKERSMQMVDLGLALTWR